MKFVLILMVRNEEKILQRCLEAVEGAVDAFCIHDTGSTDKTLEIAKEFLQTRKGCITTSVWQNFGYNRTASFQAARDYVATTGWDLATTYGILLDGDMVLQVGTLRSETLTDIGYTLIQKGGALEYPNCRLVRMDHPWRCKGVTHEYWDGHANSLPKSVAWIDDRNDGGCKSDKFERDARLLEDGLKAEPDNVRYMFYLAQTYHSLGRLHDAIALYKKRVKAGGWVEEEWYSLYMIGQSWLTLGDPIKFEKYMLKAYALRPGRAESLYKLARYFRETGQQYKAYQYVLMGKDIPLSTDSLFIEIPVYTELFHYEESILLYYVKRIREGLRASMRYLLRNTQNLESVLSNMKFYVEPIGQSFRNHPISRDSAGRDYHPSTVSSFEGGQNVRFVNYSITNSGSYDMRDGSYGPNNKVRTQNAVWMSDKGVVLKDSSITLPRRETRILGVEDVRVYTDGQKNLRFLSSSGEFSETISIVSGRYNAHTAEYSDCVVVKSPLGASCEKNWIPVNGTNDIVYSWHPLRVGHLQGSKFVFDRLVDTPSFFQHLRGSAVPVRVENELWFLVHYVEHSTPRNYFHCLVALDPSTYKPLRLSLPFVFRAQGIEYCMSMTMHGTELQFIFSSWDDNPMITDVPMDAIEWLQI
jgi:glycosyltransferase involved in cell wall biosynthesis